MGMPVPLKTLSTVAEAILRRELPEGLILSQFVTACIRTLTRQGDYLQSRLAGELSSPSRAVLDHIIYGSTVQAERGAQAIADLAATEAATKARAPRSTSTRGLQKGGVLYADRARTVKRKRQTDELEEIEKQKAAAEARLRTKWKVYKKQCRKALCIAVRGRGKVKVSALRVIDTAIDCYEYHGQLLLFKRRTQAPDEDVRQLLRVFQLSNLQNNHDEIGDPCRLRFRSEREDREDSDEEPLLHSDFLRVLYPQKYAQKEVMEAERVQIDEDDEIQAAAAAITSSPPLLSDDDVDSDLAIDPDLLMQ